MNAPLLSYTHRTKSRRVFYNRHKDIRAGQESPEHETNLNDPLKRYSTMGQCALT